MTELLGTNLEGFAGVWGWWSAVTRHEVILLPTVGLCSGKWQAIKAVPCECWPLSRVRFATSPFYCLQLHELDRHMQQS